MSSELLTVCCWAGNEGNRSTFTGFYWLTANLLGKINPKCTLLPSLFLNPVFCRVCRVCSLLCCAKLKQTAESCILFFFLFYKKTKIIFFIECTQIKADLLQFRLSSWPREVASTVRRGNKSSDCSSASCAHLSILPSQCSLFIIIIKTTGQTYGKNTHCSV